VSIKNLKKICRYWDLYQNIPILNIRAVLRLTVSATQPHVSIGLLRHPSTATHLATRTPGKINELSIHVLTSN
jgi:hypothetical protein